MYSSFSFHSCSFLLSTSIFLIFSFSLSCRNNCVLDPFPSQGIFVAKEQLHPKTLPASPYVTAPSFITTRVCQNRGMEKPSHCMNGCHSVKTMCLLGGPAEIVSLSKPPTAARYQRVTNLGKAEHDRADSKLFVFSTEMYKHNSTIQCLRIHTESLKIWQQNRVPSADISKKPDEFYRLLTAHILST